MNQATKSGSTRLLIVKLSSLGDLFHALPAVHNLQAGLNAAIDWVTQTEYVDVVKCFAGIDRVIAFPRKNLTGSLKSFLAQLREREYDYVIDLQGLLKSAIVTRLARGRQRIGPSFHRECSGLFYSSVAGIRNKDRHAVEENLDVIRHLGLELLQPEFRLNFPDWTVSVQKPRIAMCPVSRRPSKNWPIESFIVAGRMLREKTGASFFLLGGKGDEEACRKIKQELGGSSENMAGRLSLVELGSVLSGMDLMLSNDSGPMHVAAALGVPVLALFGPTDPKRTGPYGALNRVVTASIACRPCFRRTCKFGVPRCMMEITPATVVETALEML